MMTDEEFIGTNKRVAKSLSCSPEEAIDKIERMISEGNFMNAAQGIVIGSLISEGLAKGLGVISDGER